MNYKIRVANEAESKEVQELFFELGYGWRGVNPRNSIFIPKKLKEYFIINYEKTKDMQLSGVFDNSETLKTHKEITIPQLKDMVVLKRNDVSDATHTDGHYSFYVGKDKNYFFSSCDKAWRGTWKNVEILKPIEKPMKEYLVKNQHDEYVFLNDVSCVPSEFVIEVPEGMNYAYKDEFNIHFTKLEVGYRDSIIVWQHETLNDKVASAEAARQEFIGAPFSDLPEFNFEAVGDFVESNVEQTLSDRESTYGSFKDVAVTTRNLMNCIDVDSMNAVQQEALHMICSKLARIANGDPNHVDSWHDIAGYASLVVKDINGNP